MSDTERSNPVSINFMRMFYEGKCNSCNVKIKEKYEKRLEKLTEYNKIFKRISEERNEYINHKKEIYKKASLNDARKEENIYKVVNVFFKYKKVKKYDFEAACMRKIDEIQHKLFKKQYILT